MKGRITVVKRAKPGASLVKGCGSGYGFIKDEAGQERFFHSNGVEGIAFDQLQEGLAVEFEPYAEEGRGLRAKRVRVVA